MAQRQPGIVTGGLVLIGGGAWLALSGLGVPLLTLDRLWPLIPAAGGLALLAQNARQPRSSQGLMLAGVTALLGGLFLLLFSSGVGNLTWAALPGYWPVLLLIASFAFLLIYLSGGMQEAGLLVIVHLFGGLGILALPFTLGVIRGAVFSQALRLWPLLLILATLAVFLRLRSRRGSPSGHDEAPAPHTQSLGGEN